MSVKLSEADDSTEPTTEWGLAEWCEFNGTHDHLDLDETPDDADYYYVETEHPVERRCPACGFEGTAFHPHRDRPTIEAPLKRWCPDASCRATLEAVETEADEEETEPAADGGETVEFESEGLAREVDEPHGTAQVVEEFEHGDYGAKVAIETPPPWECEDAPVAPNDAIKSAEWSETHRAFDSEREAWTVDADGVEAALDALAENGYAVEDVRDEADPADVFADYLVETLLPKLREGVEVTVRYEQKNGEGMNEKGGEVYRRDLPGEEFVDEPAFVFEREDGHRMTVRPDDDGGGLYTVGAMYPYVGRVVSVELGSPDGE